MSNLSPDWILEELRDAGTSWSVGTFGAIAEFSREPDAPLRATPTAERLAIVTSKGGIRIDTLSGVRAIAFETTVKAPDHWSHAIALCSPTENCAMNRRAVMTELRPDRDALRDEDRDAILFDIGLGALQVDVCVRTADADLIGRLRASEGQSIFASDNPVMMDILAASPHRVFLARIGRAEVYQGIPRHDQKSPEGPHTHVLPKLLKANRTPSAAHPIPDGWTPCAHLYPANPARDDMGRPKPFDLSQHERFQALLKAYGDAETVALKDRIRDGVRAGHDPDWARQPQGRFATAARRGALRQIFALEGPSAALTAWREVYDHATSGGEEDAAALEGHG